MGKPQRRHNNKPHETPTLSLTQLFLFPQIVAHKTSKGRNGKINEALYQHTCKIH